MRGRGLCLYWSGVVQAALAGAAGHPLGAALCTHKTRPPRRTLALPAGFSCSRAELSADIKQLYQTGLFESVNARVLPLKKGKFQVRRSSETCGVGGSASGRCEWRRGPPLQAGEHVVATPPPANQFKYTRPSCTQVMFDFVEKRYPEIQTFNVEGARVLPKAVVAQVQEKLGGLKGQPFTMQTMALIKNIVEGW